MIVEQFPELPWQKLLGMKELECSSSGQQQTEIPMGKHYSNHTEEVEVLIVTTIIINNTSDQCVPVVFQTDTLSVLEALGNGKLDQLQEAPQQVTRHRCTVLQCVPSHFGSQAVKLQTD